MHPSPTQKKVPMVLWAEDIAFDSSSWATLCDANPCPVILLLDQRDESFFITNHDAMKKVIAFDHIHFHQL
jgi:hypothetical protein